MVEIIDLEKFEKAAFILKTVAHPMRLAIVELLTQNETLSVNEICEKINGEQSLVSHHLINMKLKGILQSSREGQFIHYSLKLKEINILLDCVQNCTCHF
ncbi:helix-turn-helix transcriptional regulator [Lacihabitans sp. CS3-21]|jgi:DNA-binding transcriptional ArsR family regulator|uniref:ArsR/SmtB family transcription factor n=1 Tax=Lacihabitans sp. CS3-21 TaxID=2487332 RepID=UPI0020CCEC33|nr:metalloregulator ArsR/SmtB family transcription factor [Lacihabitans sp. CS3-21]MCP9747294.1 transcriptional regulator [Lacihabitans sp. CS3-21]